MILTNNSLYHHHVVSSVIPNWLLDLCILSFRIPNKVSGEKSLMRRKNKI